MKSRNRETTGVLQLPNQESIRKILEKKNWNYLGIFEAETNK